MITVNPTTVEYDDIPEPDFGKYHTVSDSIISYITKRIRKTIEYQSFFYYMKRTLNVNGCAFYKDYNMTKGFTIELHHAPLTMYDIVQTIANKFYNESGKDEEAYFEPWLVEETVNKLHYRFLVGLVPLNPTAHHLVHSDKLKIHPSMVHGNWEQFVQENGQHLSEQAKEKIEEFRKLGKKSIDEVPEILKYKPVIISNMRFRSLGSINVETFIIDKLKTKLVENKVDNGG